MVYDRSTNSQAWIQLEQDKSRFLVTLRGVQTEPNAANSWIGIISEVIVSLSQHPSITMEQRIRSPHDVEASINLEDAIADAKIPNESERTLCCPLSHLPIQAEVILAAAGFESQGARAPKSSSFSFFFFFFF